MDLNKKSFTTECAGQKLTIEVSCIAEQANGAVIVSYGGTVVLSTAVMEGTDRDIDYLPLMVDYEQKFYAIGRILGSRFVRREGRASDDAVLSGRLIDRTIRPLFDHRMRRDIQVVATILSYDGEHNHNFVALIAASTALAISDIPWNGPVAGVALGKIGSAMVVNPLQPKLKEANFEAFVSGTAEYINMIELEGRESSEEDVAAGFEMAKVEIAKLIRFQEDIVRVVGKTKKEVPVKTPSAELSGAVKKFLDGKLATAIYVKDKLERQRRLEELRQVLLVHLKEQKFEEQQVKQAEAMFEEEVDATVHGGILKSNLRPDGRALDEIRPLYADVHIFERLHGSALFMRGNTQVLAVATLDAPTAEQLIETMDFSGKKHFMLHYNFPQYSVGETGSFRGPGRREIGHGALAEKAVRNLVPTKEEFPYTVRVVAETLSSNGSSSMATVCATSLALMDAGVPIKKAVGGIAMGLMSDDAGNYKILTDLQGPEDFYGDMDFKVAGTRDGITAIQLDVKIRGLSIQMVKETLAQAKVARMQVLDCMDASLRAAKPMVSTFAPTILSLHVSPERIGLIIGPGGKTINALIAETGATSIDIEQDGSVFITASTKDAAEEAKAAIEQMTKEYNIGDIISGEVIKIMDFGAIVDLGGGNDGMVHVSELKEGYVKRVEDVVRIGQIVFAKVIRVEDGRIGLSMKGIPQTK